MDSQQRKEKRSSCFMGTLMSISVLSAGAAIGLIVLTSLWGNSGLVNETSIQIQSCSGNYYTQKFGNIGIINRTVFISSILAALISLQITRTTFGWFCKKCNTPIQPPLPRAKLFFFCSCLGMSSIPPLGYYFSFYIQIKNCSNSVDFWQMIITLGVAAALITISLLLLLIVLCRGYDKQNEKKYRVVETHQTQPIEPIKYCKYNQKIDQKANNLMYKTSHPNLDEKDRVNDDTNEAIVIPYIDKNNFSPRKPVPEYRPDLNEPQQHYCSPPGLERGRHKVDQDLNQNQNRKSPVYMQERIIQNLHPQFANTNPLQYKQSQNNNKRPQLDVQEEFFRQQHRYLQNFSNNVLPRGGLQQRDKHINHDNVEYNRPEQPFNGNYAKVHHKDERGQFYSPNRARNEDFRQNGRHYTSNGNQRNYPIHPNQYYDYQNNYRHPHQRNSGNQINERNFNTQDYDHQQHSFKFYEENYPRMNHYR